ncbi:site-specific DNA-methyltransferase [Candidatus Pacearchaeota archaeon]|nr:site-specific DNA-methyltransferase [Candidatus Pacearchaeota archaeon]
MVEGEKYTYVLEDLFKYKKRKFDVTLSFGLCEHFSGKQRKAVLTKHLALLKKRGIIVISAPYKNGIFYQLSKFISKILGLWNFGQEIAFTKKEFREFAKKNNLGYKFIMGGFYSSFYDLVVRKPLKICGLKIKRRGDNSTSFLDNFFGSGIVFIGMKK